MGISMLAAEGPLPAHDPSMSRAVSEHTISADDLGAVLTPRTGMVIERARGDGRFDAEAGPFNQYRRTVAIEHLPEGRVHVRQTVEYQTAIPYFGWLFSRPMRRRLSRIGPVSKAPWWSPPDVLDAEASTALACLAALSVVAGYLGVLLSQTITFAAHEFGVGKAAQGFALASVRVDILLALPLVALADRVGRRRVLIFATAGASALTALTALAPTLIWMMVIQVPARGLATAAAIAVTVVAAEEMPAGSRAYAISILTMAAALGAGQCVILLFLADTGVRGWRLLYVIGLIGVPLALRIGRRLPESRRFRVSHASVPMAGHGRRFWLLASSAFLLALFTTPAGQFQNSFLRDEIGFSASRISLFVLLTNTPGALGIIIGGRLADVKGRRLVGAVAVFGGVGATVAMYLVIGWPLWAWSITGAIVGAATVPALGVYGPELFPTSLRGKANGIISLLGRLGSVIGLVVAGYLAGRMGRFGPALAVLSVGPLLLVVLVLVAYPETAHRELEDLNPEDPHL
jgi:MFS family permease